MGALSLVSVGLFLLPIAVTIGTLLGVEGVRRNNGEQSVFAPPPNDKITTSQFCQLGFGFTPLPDRYTCALAQPFPFLRLAATCAFLFLFSCQFAHPLH